MVLQIYSIVSGKETKTEWSSVLEILPRRRRSSSWCMVRSSSQGWSCSTHWLSLWGQSHAGLLCEKKFHGRSDMRTHISKHHGGQSYTCPFSDYRFDRTHDIIVHMVVQHEIRFGSGFVLVNETAFCFEFHNQRLEARMNIEDKTNLAVCQKCRVGEFWK